MFNMAAYVLDAGLKTPGKVALSLLTPEGSDDWTYAALRAAVLGTGRGLLDTGLRAGDIVLMRLGNTVDFPLAFLGALSVGLVPVPTSAALTLPETARIIADLSPSAILHAPDVACPADPRVISLAAMRDMRALPAAEVHMGDPNRLGYVIYTSGTSGTPRAVGHAHRAIWARQMMFEGWYGLRPSDRVLHAGAFNWTYTLGTGLMDPWTMGATALIARAGTSAAELPAYLRRDKATLFAAAPGVYRQLLSVTCDLDVPTLRHGLSAGEKLPDRVAQAWHDATGTYVYEAYGMSECSTFISSSPAHPASPGALGRPQKGRRVALLSSDGPVPFGTEGTIAVHKDDPGLMLVYLNAPTEMASRMQGEWFLTGDQAIMDQDGQITYLGRNDDMMNAGGYRVSPIEVEQALSGVPGLTALAATDVEVKDDTRVIAAFYTAPTPLNEAMLRGYAESRLARYKQPRLYIHLPELPMGGNGKVLRRALRAWFEANS